MSAAAVRQEIAEACNAITGVNVSPYFSTVTKAGTGMVRYGGTSRPNRLGGVVTWQVFVFLPENPAQAEQWLDETGPLLLSALEDSRVLSGLKADPQQLALGTGTQPVVVIEGTREEE